MQQLKLPASLEEDERLGERGFEEGYQVRGEKFGGGPGKCPPSSLPPTLYLPWLGKREMSRWKGMFLLLLTLGIKVGEDTWI